MLNKQKNNFFVVEIQFALDYCPFFTMTGVDTGLPW